ncbi:hypothetical protein [Streptomyces sp. NPDC037389]
MAIVDAVTGAHGGRVTLDSAPGHPRFRVLLPAGTSGTPSDA